MARTGVEALQKCTKQELMTRIHGMDADLSGKVEALGKAEAKATQLRSMLVGAGETDF